jgi:Phage tail tube protein
MTLQASVRSYVGIAKETTKGTAVAATDFIPVAKDSLKPVDVIDPLYDQGLRGSNVMNYNYIPGRKRSTFDFGGSVFADTIGYALAGIMGDVATVGASAPYTHTISLKNSLTSSTDTQPISYTLTDFYAVNVRRFPGCQFSDFSLKFNADGMLEFDTKATGWSSSTTTDPTPSFSTVLPTPVWRGTVSIGGSAVSYAMEGSIEMKRAVTPIYGISNTQDPYQVFLGALEVTGSIKFAMEDDTELTRYLTNTQPAIVLNWNYGSGASELQIQATITKGAYTAAAIDRGDDFVTVSVELNGQGNTTDAGTSGGFAPIKWVLKNAKASGTYA